MARARELASTHPPSAQILTFYADAAAFLFDLRQVAPALMVPPFLSWLRHQPNEALAARAAALGAESPDYWDRAFDAYWAGGGTAPGLDDVTLFVLESVIHTSPDDIRARPSTGRTERGRCSTCGGLAVVATLSERGHGALRELVCGTCLTPWPISRIECPSCGEGGFDRLPIFRAEEYSAMRLDGCQRCRTYIKTMDLTISAAADPVVDDLASLPLDLWAAAEGYKRLRPNVLRM